MLTMLAPLKTNRQIAMKAAHFHQYGGPEVLNYVDLSRPQVSEGEVLLRVHAAGVNSIDWKVRQGVWTRPLPFIPGWDVSGVIEAVGPRVSNFKTGDEVYAFLDLGRGGGYAEYVTVPTEEAVLKPRSLNHVQAAVVPMAALTAWQALFDYAQLKAGQTVLIHGAAGGVGTFAVQLAKWKGVRVIGTTSTANTLLLKKLGADVVVDYTKVRFEQAIGPVDVVIDPLGGEVRERSWQVLKPDGLLVSLVGQPSIQTANQYGVRSTSFVVQPDPLQLAQIAALIDKGYIEPVLNVVLPLEQAHEAQRLNQQGHGRGKIALRVA
jgi:NADPH:quinone reductase-like Zn-dependent oxidoreductase